MKRRRFSEGWCSVAQGLNSWIIIPKKHFLD